MRKEKFGIAAAILLIMIGASFMRKQTEPWRPDQLMEPKDLATIINDSKVSAKPLIINVGPAGLIKDAIDIGPAHEKENFDKLKEFLSKEKKDRQMVIYCGCCPFEHCPNIRPAFKLLNEMKFTNQKLLDLSHNLKADWIDKDYPMAPRQ
ncbi:MAG: rhodanese-like domain-containing protein [Chitinophagales bacterium]